jgi:hypothetical protein
MMQLPGIVVRIVNDTGIMAPPVYQRYPVIIGEGDPYKLIENQKILRYSGNSDPLPTMTGVHSIVSAGDLPGFVNYQPTTDYTLSGNTIVWTPGGSHPTFGDYYYVTYTETRASSAYIPTLYFDENLIYTDHGNKTRTNGAINDVSVGGYLALNAGCKGVIIAQLNLSGASDPDSPSVSELETAFIDMRDELEKITDYKLFLIPMSSGVLNTTTAASIFFNHAVICSQPERKQERTVLASLPSGTDYFGAASFATAYHHERMVVPFTYDGTSKVVGFTSNYDTRFYCAALAGKLCSTEIGRNISDEIIPNINVLDTYSPTIEEFLIQHGVGPVKAKGDVVRNIYIGTTDTTNALTEDLGVQDIKDYVKKYWRESLWELYRNAPITKGLLQNIKKSSETTLGYLQSKNIVDDYRDITATQDMVEPRKVNLYGKIKPAYSLQFIDVTFTFVLNFT